MDKFLTTGNKNINGWNVGASFGDKDFFKTNWVMRAGAAKGGLYGNNAEEAMYPYTRTDGKGETLDGSKHNYTITFAAGQLPPVNAFWSVTMYDGKSQLLIKNPISRYLINSPMLSSMKKKCGWVGDALHSERLARKSERVGCWLPAPNDTIYLVMRLYWPKPTPLILPPGEGTWQPPAVTQAQ